ncbi:hypothetical protein U1Q18_037900, partial [Sarracenia purpurea var. burkii]
MAPLPKSFPVAIPDTTMAPPSTRTNRAPPDANSGTTSTATPPRRPFILDKTLPFLNR